MSKIGQWVLNISAGIFFYIFFLVVYFPFESIIQDGLSQVDQLTRGAYRITVGEIDPGLFFKTKFKKLQILRNSGGQYEAWLDLPEVRVGISYISLLAGNVQASFAAKGKKGFLTGELYLTDTSHEVDVQLDQLSLDSVPALEHFADTDISGIVSGKIALDLVASQWTKGRGKVDLTIKDLHMSGTTIQGMNIPELDFTPTKPGLIKMEMNKGKILVNEFVFAAGDVAADLKGSIRLNNRFGYSRLNIDGKVQFTEKVVTAVGYIGLLDGQKNADGALPIKLTERLSEPKIKVGTMEFDVQKMLSGEFMN